jgi:hypothetical protein
MGIQYDQTMDYVTRATSPGGRLVMLVSAREAWITTEPVEFGTVHGAAQSFVRSSGATVPGVCLSQENQLSFAIGQAIFDGNSMAGKQKPVLCARLCTSTLSSYSSLREIYMVLLLEPTETVLGQYRRVGVGLIYGRRWFDGWLRREIEVV